MVMVVGSSRCGGGGCWWRCCAGGGGGGATIWERWQEFWHQKCWAAVGGVTCSHAWNLEGTENASHVLITTSLLSNSLDNWI